MPTIEKSVDVDVPVDIAYDQWTQFEEFPEFMDGVTSVRQLDDTRLQWDAEIGGKSVSWEAKITEQIPHQRVAWTSVEGKDNAGVVTFHRISDDSCRVMVQLDWTTEGMMESVGSLLGADDRKVEGDLDRFKALVEKRGSATGAWHGEIDAPETSSAA